MSSLAALRTLIRYACPGMLALVIFWAPRAGAAEPTLSFDDAVRQALSQSLDVKRAALAKEQAQLSRDQADFDLYPHIIGQVAIGDYWPKAKKTGPGAPIPPRDQSLSLQLNQTLYDFGRYEAKRKQADALIDVKNLTLAQVDDQLRWSVARAYLAVVEADRTVQVTKEQIHITEAKLRTQSSDYRNGLRPESDLVSAQVDNSRAILTDERALADETTARQQLNALVGLPATATYTMPALSETLRSTNDWQRLIAPWKAAPQDPTEMVLQAQSQATQFDEDAVRASHRPTLGVGVGPVESGAWGSYNPTLSGQITLSWDIPYNGLERDELAQVGLKRRDIDLQYQTEAKIRTDKEALARKQFAELSRQVDVLGDQVRLLERRQSLIERSFKTGHASALDVSVAEADLLSARLDRLKTDNAVASALIDLAQSMAITDINPIFH